MRTIILEPGTRQTIGRSGDTGVSVQFRALPWHQAYPAGLPYLMVTMPGGARIPVTVAYADGMISGEVPDELLVRPGLYSYVFAWVSAGEQVMSSPCGALVLDGVSRRWEPHSAAPDWAERIFLAAESIEGKTEGVFEAAAAAQDAMETATDAKDDAEDARDAAVAAKETAEEVLESIPEEYTELSNDVGDLKSAVAEMPSIAETDAESDLDLADPQGYVVARFEDGHIKTKNFDSSVEKPKGPIEWKFSGSDLLIAYGYNATVDAVVVMNEGRANGLFDFAKFCTKPKGTPLAELETSGLTVVWNSGSDMHGPFQFNATTNPDGYYSSSTDPSFTGGNHKVEISGSNVQSASTKYVCYYADGKPVTSGNGKATHFEIRWANNVQAYNCVKADGTGRTSLIEYHDMVFDGVEFTETVNLIPSEEIKMQLWYGFQAVSYGTTYTNIRFVDGTNRNIYSGTSAKSGNEKTSGMVLIGTTHTLEMSVDTECDLGKREYYTGDKGAFTSSTKAYFNIINNEQVTMGQNDSYCLKGSYRFMPTIN